MSNLISLLKQYKTLLDEVCKHKYLTSDFDLSLENN